MLKYRLSALPTLFPHPQHERSLFQPRSLEFAFCELIRVPKAVVRMKLVQFQVTQGMQDCESGGRQVKDNKQRY